MEVTPKEEARFNKQVNDMVNSLETITYYKHHYVRKTGLKRKIKDLIIQARIQAIIDTTK